MSTFNKVLALLGATALLAGCASPDNSGSGAMGNEGEQSYYSGRSAPVGPPPSAPFGTEPSGANGSVSRNNPFGAGVGSGLAPAS